MTENRDPVKANERSNSPRSISDNAFAAEFLADDAVALIIKQHLLPDDVENPVVFPPTYLRARGKTQEDEKDNKEEKKESKKDQQKSVYNIDELGDDERGDKRNVCEIDSPQSDGNRSEPLFKSDALKQLVPQIEISVNKKPCNLLDAGHRAGDAVVRFSSLAADFHAAFIRASAGDHSLLATLAPTSLLYGVWDSRSTQTKLQRIIKGSIRAQNVRQLTRSATFIPPVDYVKVGAISEERDVGEGDNNPLSSEGLKYALASQTLGGVRLTDLTLLVRTVKINLVALRQLRAIVEPTNEDLSKTRTAALRKYILGLALVAATSDPDLNLREGCNLRVTGEDHWLFVKHRIPDERIRIQRQEAITFTKTAGQEFFKTMGVDFDNKDRLDAIFEKDVAEEFLGLTDAKGKPSSAERDKVRALGPITRETLTKYYAEKKKREKEGDPINALQKLVDALSTTKADKFNKGPRGKLEQKISEIEQASDSNEELKKLAEQIKPQLSEEAGAAERKRLMLALFPTNPAVEAAAESISEAAAEVTQ